MSHVQTIFISYRRIDAAYAGRLSDALVQRFGGDRVFLDVDAIVAGKDFEARIGKAIDQSSVVIAVIGQHWYAGKENRNEADGLEHKDYVRFELAVALEKNVPIVPVLVGDTEMPEAARLPAEFAKVARLNAVRLSDVQWQRDVDVLTGILRSSFQVPPSRFNRTRDLALGFALASAGLLIVSVLMGRELSPKILGPIVDAFSWPALIGYIVLVGWLARFTGGSRLIAMSILAGLAVYLRIYGAHALALLVIFGSVLLFRDIATTDEKSVRRLVDRSDYLLEGTVVGAAIGSVLPILLLYVTGEIRAYTALGSGLILGALTGLIFGVLRHRQHTKAGHETDR